MGNVNMPAPVAFAGAALCVLGGYLVGAVAGPDTMSRTTAEVVSYDAGTEQLCLVGDAISDVPEADGDQLCGTWRHTAGAARPEPGDEFRFVTMRNEDSNEDGDGDQNGGPAVFIYGDVAP